MQHSYVQIAVRAENGTANLLALSLENFDQVGGWGVKIPSPHVVRCAGQAGRPC